MTIETVSRVKRGLRCWNMLEKLAKKESDIDKFLDSSKNSPNIILHGAGFALPSILEKLERYGFSVLAICDSDEKKQGGKYEDTYPIMSVEEASRRFPNARFLISSPQYFWEINSLLSKILDEHQLCDVDLDCAHYFEKGEFNAFFKAQLPRFSKVYERLEDDASKETYFKVIKAHMSGKREDFDDAFTGNEDWYLFKSLLQPMPDTIYIDCGAFDGDTIELFLGAANKGYEKVFAFEPDPSRLSSLNEISDDQNGKIEVIPRGVSNENGNISFKANGVYSTLVKNGSNKDKELISVSVVKLDNAINNEEVSVIKMDIEGGEYDALVGAARLIKKHKPKLAICLYHKVEDFVRIAELILQLVPEYKLRLRHQSRGCTDTILFATLD